MSTKIIRIGGASGYWGETIMSVPQLLSGGKLDYLVFDYLAEITMSIMARAKAADTQKGYAVDFVSSTLKSNLMEIAKQGIKVISNAGGVNPEACGVAIRDIVSELGLDLKVAVITGDDILPRLRNGELADVREMFDGSPLPPSDKLMSANAYIGAFPIAKALDQGADIVVTGRCVDSAVTLGACVHAFGWACDNWDVLAGGSLAGHVIECGPQVTGGNFTDWQEVADNIAEVGYPIAEVSADGSCVCTKPKGTGGMVSVGTVSEQILYEIGDPQAYILPDVTCDFSEVSLSQDSEDRVRMTGTKGRPASDTYKVSATYMDGFRGQVMLPFIGFDASKKANTYIGMALARARKKLHSMNYPDFEEINIEMLGDGSQFGVSHGNNEVVAKLGVKHVDREAVSLLLKEIMGAALATPAGLSGFGGGRPKPSPIVRLFSHLVSKKDVPVSINFGYQNENVDIHPGTPLTPIARPSDPAKAPPVDSIDVPLVKLAWGRSGDKGDKANIGIIARKAQYFPYIAHALSEDVVAERFSHFLKGNVERYVLPGLNALNFLLHDVLGGGGIASLRTDPQGKAYAQILLDHPIPIPAKMVETI